MLKKGFIQVYTGSGKGKTTAAIGLAIRALGAGLRVAFLQFFKPGTSSEVKILKTFSPQLLYAHFHKEGFVKGKPSSSLKEEILKGYSFFKELLKKREFDVIILDEIVYALNWDIIDLEDFLKTLKEKPEEIEIVITGREAPEALLQEADLVTIMVSYKHYFEKGIPARTGIEK